MKWQLFASTWRGLKTENLLYRTLVPVLVLGNVISMAGWISKDRITVLVPPTLTEATSISKRSSDGGYKKAWAMFAAGLLGNVTPGTADMVVETLQLLMNPRIFSELRTNVASDVEMIKKDAVSISFEQKTVMYERETDKVFVIGRAGISNAAGVVSRFDRVFEMRIVIDNGQPQIVELNTYQGKPRTLDVLKSMASTQKPAESQ